MSFQLLDPISIRSARRADGPVCAIVCRVDWGLDVGPLLSDVQRHAEKLLRVTAKSWSQSLEASRTEASNALPRKGRSAQRSFHPA